MKKLSRFTATALLSASLLIPANALATDNQSTSDTVTPASTTVKILEVFSLTKDSSAESVYFYVNTPGTVVFNTTQNNKSYDSSVTYLIVRDEAAGWSTTWGGARFEGNGSFQFTSREPLPVGAYYVKVSSRQYGKTAITLTATTP
ncbi:hypothetical protein [Brevibacillus borstelensis]|uniref:hypothetical protein n=1 Tax=Brevibacillus borstelensis TaxID=45462 RepID=UPI0011428AE5|nr:hypothetical protein [Brevibacillus borstelensis]MED1885164.1 hypothetical protein [Brevibacillus borstelensis]GED53595.1 hypothetical protein BBO01nite_28360 [Brevibacillus borstelensis]